MKRISLLLIFLIIFFILSCCIKISKYTDEVYFLRAHKLDEQTINIWEKMLQELPEDRCFIIFDNTRKAMNDDFLQKYQSKIIVHTEDDCKKLNPLHEIIYNNLEATFVIAYDALPIKPNFAWYIENDVYCDGNFSTTLNIDDTQTDFIATYIRTYDEDKVWTHYDEFKGEIANTEISKKMASFFPVVRCSKKMIDLLRDNMGKSSGYCEGYFPTLATLNGLTCKNIPSDKLGKFEFNQTVSLSNLPQNGDNKLYHKFVFK